MIALRVRVRLACAIGAVLSSLMGSSAVFAEIPGTELSALVRDAVHDLMAVDEQGGRGETRLGGRDRPTERSGRASDRPT